MNPLPLMVELRRLGVILDGSGETLKINAPTGVLTVEHKAALKKHKAEILSHLRSEGVSGLDTQELVGSISTYHEPVSPCRVCGEELRWEGRTPGHMVCPVCHPPPHEDIVIRWIGRKRPARKSVVGIEGSSRVCPPEASTS